MVFHGFGPRVSNGNVFGLKEVGLGPVLVTVTFLAVQDSSIGDLVAHGLTD